jgi:hypothetical protein
MPFTGGYNPSPERYGGGDGTTNAPHLQRVFESIAAARGKAFDQTLNSAVGAENMALARAIAFDLFGANVRMGNEMLPPRSTAAGMLPRWEKILGAPPFPGDAEATRRARLAKLLLRFGVPNTYQPVIDAVSAVLGPLYVGLTLASPSNANVWWPGLGGAAAQITTVSGNLVTVAGLSNVPTDAAAAKVVLSNCATAGNNGTFPVHQYVSSSSVVFVNNGAPALDNGVGGTGGSPTIVWTMPNPATPWESTVAHVAVHVDPTAAPGYLNPDGTIAGTFYAKVNQINPILDLMLPADVTFDWYVFSSHGALGFYLDEQDLDVEAFDI